MAKHDKNRSYVDSSKTSSPSFSQFADLVYKIVSIPNPQEHRNGKPGEAELASWICNWLAQRKIPHTCDLAWGVHAVCTGPDGAGDEPGVLLIAHMDSDHLRIADLSKLRLAQNKLMCPGEVGLDCKTGIAIALSVLDRLRVELTSRTWQVHVLFTVGEESGQKGAIRAPLRNLLARKVRHGVVIDRMTSGSMCPHGTNGRPVRHVVTRYKGVPLLEPSSGVELLALLNAGHAAADPAAAAALNGGQLPQIESPNCADAIELRGRWDAECVAPALLAPSDAVTSAHAQYKAATEEIRAMMELVAPNERVSSMNAPPRITRYIAMRKMYDALYDAAALSSAAVTFDPRLCFSCVNLSYDYDDAWDECDIEELDVTANILKHMCMSYFASKSSGRPATDVA